ncbi:MAG TPA: ATP-binding protein, partial [Pseudonocardia sp.]
RGLGARFCRLTVLRPGLRERDYLWTDGPASEQLDPDDLVALPISQGNEQIGSIAVDRGAVAGLRSERRTLLQDVADSLGAIVAASRTGIELERQLRAVVANAEEIAVSRRQAVAEMDSERRTIERDLHDGAQHHLVTLRLSLGLVEHEVASGQLEQARDRLGQLAGQLDTVGEVLAKTASGVSSIVLSEQGVVQALTAELTSASGGQPGVELVVEDVARRCRLAASAEAAVYFCCLESVNNARKHAEGAPIAVHIGLANGELWFRVRDEGPGFDPAAVTGSGRGQRNLAARMQAVGGVVAIESEPGAGTTVRGTVPLPPEARTEPSVPPARPSGAPVPAGSAASVVALATTPLSQASQQPGPPPTRPPARRPGPPPARQPSQLPPRRPPMPGGPGSLFARAHELLAAARQVYRGGPGRARLEQLAGRMTEPLRVVLAGDPGAGTSTLCRALASLPPSTALPPYLRLIDGGPPSAAGGGPLSAAGGGPLSAAGPPPDVLVLVLRGPGDDDPRLFGAQPAGLAVGLAPVVGVLARADQLAESAAVAIKRAGQVAEAYLAEPEVRHACQGMLVASGLLGLLGGTVTQQEYQYLVAIAEHPDQPPAPSDAGSSDRAPLERFGVVGMRVAVELIKDGSAPNRDRLAAELVSRSGLLELRGLLTGRFAEVAGALRVRSALAELEALVHASPPALPGLERFSYQLERFRSGAHELVELELVEAIRSGRVRLAGGDRHAAEQLLGMAGDSPAARLGLAIDADPAAIQLAAAHQLAQWQRIASHPVTTGAVREAADFLIRTCEELLARR